MQPTRTQTAVKAGAAAVLSSVMWLMATMASADAASTGATTARPPVSHKPGQAAALAAEQAKKQVGQAPAPGKTPSAPAPAPTPSAPAPTQTAAPVTGDVGATGEGAKAIEQRLDSLHYEVGPVDGTYDEDTAQGVTAFQKVNGMPRTGRVTADVWDRMQNAKPPTALVPDGGAKRVEIDLARQVLFLYENNKLSRIIPVSTGNEVPYCENGSCGNAVTPTGDFKVYRQGSGWEYGPLGGLYNPAYFVGGVAIHGSLSVPPEPASHGCVRVPMSVAEWLPDKLSVGTPVYVR